ncbi:STM3941 family protein [Alkalihalobacillus trypoxylicola]|uniref:DUF5673 domain-containing protein n=1 Tax=Alkalihalobacillus trypoxylicola TaxID=519424 RepID=A0A161PXM0_9BACI|nr:STM3941 family protein [Alkalihalobacillus trypoxylicola]KYG26962.1 hypothetical protein AZF04_11510 [Alkalihalobacillus trypoxylicola]
MKERRFYFSQSRMRMFMLLTLGLSIFLFAIIYYEYTETGSIDFFILAVSVLLLFLSVVFRKKMNAGPVVVMNGNGIDFLGTAPKFGFVSWDEIKGAVLFKTEKQIFVGFLLENEDEFMEKYNGISLELMKLNQRMGNPVVNISYNNLKDKEEFIVVLQEFNVDIYEAS